MIQAISSLSPLTLPTHNACLTFSWTPLSSSTTTPQQVTFSGKGDERPGRPADDLVFVIKEAPNAVFKRAGDDLETVVKLPLATALCGGTIQVPAIDGSRVPMTLTSVIPPGAERTVAGQGMPINKGPKAGQRGDMRVKFEVVFPTSLTEAQKTALRPILSGAR